MVAGTEERREVVDGMAGGSGVGIMSKLEQMSLDLVAVNFPLLHFSCSVIDS